MTVLAEHENAISINHLTKVDNKIY